MLKRGTYVAFPEAHPTAIETIERIEIPLGQPVEVTGRIKAADTVNYLFQAQSYDILAVSLSASSKCCAFNVYSPNESDPIYDGWADGPDWGDTLHRDGEFRIELYMGFKAERGEEATFTLRIERPID
ncbi:hypothetical protein [Sinorhizobium sp. RAC02]|uniref:hypothetical protein n=1 Tax=Sinorhizobium sp. RAC02 TaxID=1842534 RepID=UPI00083DA045|nr:hypothetical protein [Sinorhizobium sp. RAC02]AOF90160.1 hypothetical protein BSY16_2459 [Sinorhizobium sp. RAC02]